MIDELLLLSGNDIPFMTAGVIIHQPRLRQIAYITQERFWSGCQFLKFNKEFLDDQDKKDLLNQSNFNIIMSMMHSKDIEARIVRVNILSILTLIFPQYTIKVDKDKIQLRHNKTQEVHFITEQNYPDFKNIIINIFCLEDKENKQYNPGSELAKKIADKLMQGRRKKAQLESSDNKKIAILSRYISILAVGLHKDINSLMNYTVYQLIDEFTRFQLKLRYDSWMSFKCAGAQDMEDPQEWTKDIHEEPKDEINTLVFT